jgi:glycerate kinase
VALAKAKMKPGFEIVAEVTDLDAKIQSSALVITGEGQLDHTSFEGKVVGRLADRCQRYKVPFVVLAGSITPEGRMLLNQLGGAGFSIVPGPVSLEEAVQRASEFLRQTTEQIANLWTKNIEKGRLD